MHRITIGFFSISSICFALTCLILGIIMSQQCISITFYTDYCCEITGKLTIKKALSSVQGISSAKICDSNQTVTLRYPPSEYWRLYVNTQSKIEDWYYFRTNQTFHCKTKDGIAVTEDCDYILPLVGIILSLIDIILTIFWLYFLRTKKIKNTKPEFITRYNNTEFRPIHPHNYDNLKTKKRVEPVLVNPSYSPLPVVLPEFLNSPEISPQNTPIYSRIDSPTLDSNILVTTL